MGYRLRRVPKTKPQKKIPETDALYGNSWETRDFLVDGLDYWWRYNKQRHPNITK
jgi:hypothetical protein